MSYQTQRYLSIAVSVLLAGLAVIQLANPADFGLTPVMAHWLGVIVAMLGVLAGFLPSVRGMGNDPDFLVHRIEDLSPEQRQHVATTLANHAEQDRLIVRPPTWLPPAPDAHGETGAE